MLTGVLFPSLPLRGGRGPSTLWRKQVKDDTMAYEACDCFGYLNEIATVSEFKAVQSVAKETRKWIECTCKSTQEMKGDTTACDAWDWFSLLGLFERQLLECHVCNRSKF